MLLEEKEKSSFLTISYHGLGLSCFNKKTKVKKNETAILRLDNHKLTINLFEIKNEEKVKGYQFCNGNIPTENIEIEIKATKNPKIKGYKKYQKKGRFNRLNLGNDEYDLRWITNIEGREFHNSKLAPVKKRKILLSKMTIQNGEFYCRSKSENALKIQKGIYDNNLSNFNTSELTTKDFGFVGFEMGVSLQAEEVTITIRQKGEIIDQKILINSSNVRYLINIENLCDDNIYNEVEGDFIKYYEILSPPSKAFNLNGRMLGEKIDIPNSLEGEGSGKLYFCGMAFVGGQDSIDYLFEE